MIYENATSDDEEYVKVQAEDLKPAADETINLVAQDLNANNQFHFRMKRGTKIKKLLLAYCERRSLDYKTTQFSVSGRRLIHRDQTPDSLGLEDNTVIQVMAADDVLPDGKMKIEAEDVKSKKTSIQVLVKGAALALEEGSVIQAKTANKVKVEELAQLMLAKMHAPSEENARDEKKKVEAEEDIKPASDFICLIVQELNGNHEVNLLMKRRTKIKKLLRAYCHRQSLDYKLTKFFINGCPLINHNQNPNQLALEDSTVIQAMTTAEEFPPGKTKIEAEDVKPVDDCICLLVKDPVFLYGGSGEIHFRMKRYTKINKLLQTYCDRRALDYKSTEFFINNQLFNHDQTPYQLELEEGSVIQAKTATEVKVEELAESLAKMHAHSEEFVEPMAKMLAHRIMSSLPRFC